MRVIYISDPGSTDTIPTVVLHSLFNITSSAVNYNAEITNDGGGAVTQRGIEVNEKNDFTGFYMSDYYRTGTGAGYWSGYLAPLEANKVYYARAFGVNYVGIGYSSVIQFTTTVAPTIPEVVLNSISGVTQTSNLFDATVNNEGGATVTQRGVNFYSNPQCTGGSIGASAGSGLGNFTGVVTTFLQNTSYYARAYATNSYGTAVSNVIEFKTASTATVPVVHNISMSTTGVVTSWDVSSDLIGNGGSPVTVSGLVACPVSMGTPTIDNYTHKTTNGPTTPGTIQALLQNLTQSTQYYVKGYATNAVGTGYSIIGSFMVSSDDGYELLCEFQTNCAPTKKFYPRILGSGLFRWNLGDGTIVNGTYAFHSYANTGVKTVKLYGKSPLAINSILFTSIDIVGHLNLSHPAFSTVSDWSLSSNTSMTGLSLPSVISVPVSCFSIGWNSSFSGVLNLSAITQLTTDAKLDLNFCNITSISFAPSVSGTLHSFYCGYTLISNLDLRAFAFSSILSISVPGNVNISSILWNPNSAVAFDGVAFFSGCPLLKYIPIISLSNCINANKAKIAIADNALTATQLNRMLVEIDSISISGYTDRTIWIGGNNAIQDSSSGGYNGTAALASLLSKGFIYSY